jgi:hypothetical protein
MINSFSICISVIIYVIIRYVFWLKTAKDKDITLDGYLSMLFVKEFKKNGRKRIQYYPNEIIVVPLIYPTFGAKILSLLKINIILKFVGLMNSVIDLLYLLVIILCLILLKLPSYSILLTSMVFIFLPTIFGLNFLNSMHFSLTWRDLGRFVTTCYFISIAIISIASSQDISNGIYMIPIFIYILAYYSTLFGLQAIVFGSIIFTILSFNPVPIIILIVSNIILLIFDTKYYIVYHRSRYKFFKNYYYNIRHSHPGATGNYSFSFLHILDAVKNLISFRFKSFKKIAFSDPLLRGLMLFPIQLPVIFGLFQINSNIASLLSNWYFASIILWGLTLNSTLKIFGEPDRYLEYIGYFPILIGLGYYSSMDTNWFSPMSISIYLVSIVQMSLAILYILKSYKVEKNRKIVNRLIKNNFLFLRNQRVFPISMSESRKIAYLFDCTVLRAPTMHNPTEFKFITNYPWPNWDNFIAVCLKYEIKYIVIANEHFNICNFKIINNISKFIQKNEHYSVYKILEVS